MSDKCEKCDAPYLECKCEEFIVNNLMLDILDRYDGKNANHLMSAFLYLSVFYFKKNDIDLETAKEHLSKGLSSCWDQMPKTKIDD